MPVATDGLTAQGRAALDDTLAGGLKLLGVNAMTMNYGSSTPSGGMLRAVEQSLEATAGQVAQAYEQRGVTLDAAQRWAHVGATPMIGQNDVDGEVFTLDDASGLASFATSRGLGRVSMWSLNRDAPCGASFADVTVHSNTCSGVDQKPLAFANVFTTLPGHSPVAPAADAITVPDPRTIRDDPATSPYPIWRPTAQYPESYKVVWHGQVYEAKWFNQGTDPSMKVSNPWDSPWALIGPVGAGDTRPTITTLPPGTYPDWNPTAVYQQGDRVLLSGLPYEARWTTKGDAPQTDFPVSTDSPWQPLFQVPGEPAGS